MTSEVHASSIIKMPRSSAWEKLRDISLAHHYVPGLVNTEIVSQEHTGVGASRYVYRSASAYVQETVEEWNEGEGFLIRLHKGDKPAAPFKRAWFRYQLSDTDDNQTLFTATLRYEMPGGGLGRWLGKKMEPFVQRTIADVTIAMKLYYETGEPTSPAALKAYKSAHA